MFSCSNYVYKLKKYHIDISKQVNNNHNLIAMVILCIILSYLSKINKYKLEEQIIIVLYKTYKKLFSSTNEAVKKFFV